MQDNYLYIFLHIPKTGGTTLVKHLKNNFKHEELLELDYEKIGLDPGIHNFQKEREKIENYILGLSQRKRNSIKVIWGHIIPYGIHKIFNRPPRYLTFVRKPQEKIESFYNYIRSLYENESITGKSKNLYVKNLLVGNRIPEFSVWFKEKFVKKPLTIDHLTYREYFALLGYLENKKGKFYPADVLSKFYFIGITENNNSDYLYLYQLLGINKFFFDQNKSEKYAIDKDLKSFNREFQKINPWDMEFYEQAIKFNGELRSRNRNLYKNMLFRTKRMFLLPVHAIIYDFGSLKGIISSKFRKIFPIYSTGLDKIRGKYK